MRTGMILWMLGKKYCSTSQCVKPYSGPFHPVLTRQPSSSYNFQTPEGILVQDGESKRSWWWLIKGTTRSRRSWIRYWKVWTILSQRLRVGIGKEITHTNWHNTDTSKPNAPYGQISVWRRSEQDSKAEKKTRFANLELIPRWRRSSSNSRPAT